MDPATLALINAGSNIFGSAVAKPPSSARGEATSGGTLTAFTGDWTVAFGKASATSQQISPFVLIIGAVALLIGLKIFKRKA